MSGDKVILILAFAFSSGRGACTGALEKVEKLVLEFCSCLCGDGIGVSAHEEYAESVADFGVFPIGERFVIWTVVGMWIVVGTIIDDGATVISF